MEMQAPVAAEVTPPNPQQTLGTLSSLIGLQQQRQALQTGQYTQQAAAAAAQSQQEQMRERMQLQQTMQNGVDDQGNPIKDANGEIIPDAMVSYARRALPLIGNQVAQSILTTQSNKTSLQSAVADLQQKYRTQIGSTLQGFYGSNANSKQIDAQLDELGRQNPDMLPSIHWAETLTPHLDSMQGPQKDQALSHLVGTFTGESAQKPTTINTLAAVQGGTVNAATGAITPAGAGVPLQLSPAQRLPQGVTNATGNIVNRSPVTGQLSPAPQAAPPGVALNPSTAQAAAQIDDNTRYQQISNAGQMAETGENLSRNVAMLAQGVRTGKFSGEAADWLATIRQHDPGLTDRQLLTKYAAQLQNTAIGAAGADTDLGRGVVLHGMPNPDTMTPAAIVDAARYIGGIFGLQGARSQVATNYVKATGGSPVGLRANVDQQFMANANPDVFTYSQLSPGPERQAWLKSHGYGDPANNARLRQQLKAMSQYGINLQ